MKNDGFYLRNPNYSFHYDDNAICVYMGSTSTRLNQLYAEIVEKCDGKNSLSNIVEGLFTKYDIKENDDEARQLFTQVIIHELLTHKIIKEVSEETPSHKVKPITGKVGASFPGTVLLEVTNRCNFCCKHCFKNAKANSTNYISVPDLEYFFSKLSVPFESVQITGGECTLHPQINDIIAITAMVANKVDLLSNGSNIQAITPDKLSLVNSVQVTIYGYDHESYKSFTSNERGFDLVKEGLGILKSQNTNLIIAVTITKNNYMNLDRFIEFACQFNPNEIRFSLVLPFGRASENEYYENFELSDEEFLEVEKHINEWADRLSSLINVHRIGGLFLKEADDTNTLKCTGGKYKIIISENGIVRPCTYLPEDLFSMGTIKQYVDDILNRKVFDFTKGVSEFKEKLLKEGFNVADMKCIGFCKGESSDCHR